MKTVRIKVYFDPGSTLSFSSVEVFLSVAAISEKCQNLAEFRYQSNLLLARGKQAE